MNTRFNPTVNGPLHVGHLYLVLLNRQAARDSGGQFIVRFDDDQTYWDQLFTREQIKRMAGEMLTDLEWLGITPDRVTSEHDERSANEEVIRSRLPNPGMILADRPALTARLQPKTKTIPSPYPYTPYLTGVKVVQDWRERIDLLIRGEDLVTEFSLYCYFCDLAGFPRPVHQYVPRMMRDMVPYGQVLQDLVDDPTLSKTGGGYTLRAYREKGWTPSGLLEMAAESTLKDPAGGWTCENVKRQPVLRRCP